MERRRRHGRELDHRSSANPGDLFFGRKGGSRRCSTLALFGPRAMSGLSLQYAGYRTWVELAHEPRFTSTRSGSVSMESPLAQPVSSASGRTTGPTRNADP
jgi:hypothetical protein